jgi:hypothetical protein
LRISAFAARHAFHDGEPYFEPPQQRTGLHDRILYLVLTKGVPLRIAGTTGFEGMIASVDSELTLLYRRLAGDNVQTRGRIDNPYFLGARPVAEAKAFTHRDHDIAFAGRDHCFAGDHERRLLRGGLEVEGHEHPRRELSLGVLQRHAHR